MRERVGAGFAIAMLVFFLASPAAAFAPAPSVPPGPDTPVAGAGQAICKVSDSRIAELSGLVATQSGYVAINDSQSDQSKMKIFTLDNACKVVGTPVNLVNPAALDPEDLAVDKSGTVWLADIGDNDKVRKTIAVRSWASGARDTTIYRMTFPDGRARNSEALLLNGDGTPIIITKDPPGEIYVPEGPLVPKTESGVKLKKAGTFNPQRTNTPNPLGFVGERTITGGAVSPDGTKAVVRTLSDAYEFDVTNGEVVKAITTGKPRITPLPQEPQGEAITFSIDGKSYVTVSDTETSKTTLLRYTPTNVAPAKTGGPAVASPKGDDRSFFEKLSLQDITYMVAGVGVLGLLFVVAGIIGIRRSRTNRRAAMTGPARASAAVGAPPGDADDLLPSDGRRGKGFAPEERTGTVYGGGSSSRPAGRSPGSPPISGRSSGPPPTSGRGAVYGAKPTRDDYGRDGHDRDGYDRDGYEPAGFAPGGGQPGDYPQDYDGYDQRYGRRR